MYQEYDIVVSSLVQDFEEQKKSFSVLYKIKRSAQMFREYMVAENIPYSVDAASNWVDNMRSKVPHHTYKGIRYTHYLIAGKIAGEVDRELFYKSIQSNYDRLPSWAQEVVDDFLANTLNRIHSIGGYKHGASTLLLEFIKTGGTSLSEIQPLFIADFRKQYGEMYGITAFLDYLITCHGSSKMLVNAYNWSFHDRIFTAEGGLDPVEWNEVEYCEAKEKVLTYLKNKGYSNAHITNTASSLNEFGLFLASNKIGCSEQNIEIYLEKLCLNIQEGAHRRSVLLINYVLSGKDIENVPPAFARVKLQHYSEWFEPYALAYRDFRVLNHIGNSALESDRSALKRLSSFLDQKGVKAIDQITPLMIHEFILWDTHSTPGAKQHYIGTIRNFFSYLESENITNCQISAYLPTATGRRVRPCPKTLTDDQYRNILSKCSEFEATGRFLEPAVIKLALWTGLRSCDICNLKAENIDFDKDEIIIVQSKTKVSVRIPIPTELENLIYRYVLYNRSNVISDYIFVSQKAPIRPLTNPMISNMVSRVSDNEVAGTHILRRTYATSLLKSNVNISAIADALGHVSDTSIDYYLDTNNEMMLKCNIPLSRIPYKGGLL